MRCLLFICSDFEVPKLINYPMKKTVLFLSAAMISVCGLAQQDVLHKQQPLQHRSFQDGPISTHHLTPAAAEQLKALSHQPRRSGSVQQPTVTPRTYALSGYFFTYAGMAYASGLAQQVAVEGSQVYLNNLFPIMLEDREVWTVGELNEEGNVITVPVQHVYDDDWYALGTDVEFYMGDIIFDEEANITGVRPFEFCKEGDYIYMDDLNDVDEEGYAVVNHRIGIFAYGEDENDIQLYDYVAGHKLTPYEAGELVECPADARVEEYVYNALDDYGDPVAHQLQVAFSGNDIYFNGLTPDQPNWVHGTLGEDNVVTIPSGQYVGVQKYFYTYFASLSVAGYDPNGDANFYINENFELIYDPETGVFTDADPEQFVGELIYVGGGAHAVFAAFGELSISPLGVAKAATPSNPYEVFVMDLEDYGYEQWDFGFMLDNTGTEGEYLFPENLKVCMFMDDVLFTFEPEEYMIPEPITFVGYTDIDSNDAFYHDANIFDFYVNKSSLFNTLGTVAVYTANGETRYSEMAVLDIDTEEVTFVPLTAEQIEQISGQDIVAIEQLKDESQSLSRHFNLMGQPASSAAGIVISKGRKMLRK